MGSYDLGILMDFRDLSKLDLDFSSLDWNNFYTNVIDNFPGFAGIEVETGEEESDLIETLIFGTKEFDGTIITEKEFSSSMEFYTYAGISVTEIAVIKKCASFLTQILDFVYILGESEIDHVISSYQPLENPFGMFFKLDYGRSDLGIRVPAAIADFFYSMFGLINQLFKVVDAFRFIKLFGWRELFSIAEWNEIGKLHDLGKVGKATAVISFISAGISFLQGFNAWSKAQLATGISEGVRGVLSVVAGVLVLIPTPFTTIVAGILALFDLILWIFETFFGIDLIEAFVGLFGFVNAYPQCYSDFELDYDKEKLERQHGFREGDYLGLNLTVINTGNTLLLSTLQVRAGTIGPWGDFKKSPWFCPGVHTKINARDTFNEYTTSPSLTYLYTVNWAFFYPGLNFLGWWIIPPTWWFGNLEWGYNTIPLTASSIIVFPKTIGEFVDWMDSEEFAPPPKPDIQIINRTTKIDPKSENNKAEFDIILTNPTNMDLTYNVTVETADFAYLDFESDDTYENWIEITVPAANENGGQYTLPLDIYVPSKSLVPAGPQLVRIYATPKIPTASQLIARTGFEVEAFYDFEATFAPEIPEKIDIEPGQVILQNITIENLGNAMDAYDIEIIDERTGEELPEDYYVLSDTWDITGYIEEIVDIPENDYGFSGEYNTTEFENASGGSPEVVAPLHNKTVYLTLTPPRVYTTTPGPIPFTIRITSKNDSSVIKEYHSTLNILEYYDAQFNLYPDMQFTRPGSFATNHLGITNLGNINDTYSLSISPLDFQNAYEAYPTAIPEEWITTNATLLSILPGLKKSIEISTQIPEDWEGYEDTTYGLDIFSTSINEPDVNISKIINITVNSTTESKIRYILRELKQLRNDIADLLSEDLANQLIHYVNKSINRTKDALDSLLIGSHTQTIKNLTKAELELRFLKNLIRVKIISGDIIKEVGLELIHSLHHIRDHIILTPSFLVNSVTKRPEATELGDINLEIVHIIDAIKDSLDDDNIGLEFTRCWDNISYYLPFWHILWQ
ncbi:MAG: hypothetical protein ACTSRG_22150 [Candidatus Helarchaeota archaeon]